MLHGNLSGLKTKDLHRLERLYRRKIPVDAVVSGETARAITELSLELNRQIGLLIQRNGQITHVIVGDAKGLFLPDLKNYPLGQKRLRGLRLVHTHLNREPLTNDDLTDLALLRLDLIAAVCVTADGFPGLTYIGVLKPGDAQREVYETWPGEDFHHLSLDVRAFLDSREEEMQRLSTSARRTVKGDEQAILVSVSTAPKWQQEDSVSELDELARSSNVVVLDHIVQRPQKIDPSHLIGAGKLKDLIIRAMQLGATIIIFDQDLTPAQGTRIAEATELKVIDRTQLILDIFARRAHSREGKVQVELAQLKYRLPRLTGRGTQMSRLMGGIGGRGPGEMKLEVDRRRVRDRLGLLEKELKSISAARKQRKARRAQAGIPIISIVGYTNAGKSTLLNALTRSQTHVEEKMFATLDTASRRLRFPRERDVIITDTVGFIRDLPKDLFNAFRATLEEMEDADMLLHLVDVSNSMFEQQIDSVTAILEDLGYNEKPRMLVFNKIDRLEKEIADSLCERFDAVGVSALDKDTLPALLHAIESGLWPSRGRALPYDGEAHA